MNELKISVLLMRKKMLFSGEIYLQKFYTAAGSDGSDKFHLWMRTSHTKRCPAKTSEERLKIVIGGLCNRGGRLLGSLFAAYLCECLVIDNVFLKIN